MVTHYKTNIVSFFQVWTKETTDIELFEIRAANGPMSRIKLTADQFQTNLKGTKVEKYDYITEDQINTYSKMRKHLTKMV